MRIRVGRVKFYRDKLKEIGFVPRTVWDGIDCHRAVCSAARGELDDHVSDVRTSSPHGHQPQNLVDRPCSCGKEHPKNTGAVLMRRPGGMLASAFYRMEHARRYESWGRGDAVGYVRRMFRRPAPRYRRPRRSGEFLRGISGLLS